MKDLLTKLKANNIHLSLDKDDLKVKFNDNYLPQDIITELKQNKGKLIEYLQNNGLDEADYTSIGKAPDQPCYVLSSSQRRLWILCQDEQANVAYNVPRIETFKGELNLAALQAAFDTLLGRHEGLRTIFREDQDGIVKQWIRPADEHGFLIELHDLRTSGDDEAIQKLLTAGIQKGKHTPFVLDKGPLLRVDLYRLSATDWVFCYVIHHIVCDGWSLNLMVRAVGDLYRANCLGKRTPLAPLEIQYKDYATWQQRQLNEGGLRREKKYWLKQLEGDLPVLGMPSDKSRPVIKTYKGEKIGKVLNRNTSLGIRQLTHSAGATLFMGLLAVVDTLLYRYTDQEDIIIGSPIAGRVHPDLENQLGFYLNTLPLRSRFKGSDNFMRLLENVKEITLGAYECQAYPFDELVENLGIKRDMSRSALFDVMVGLQNTEIVVKKPDHTDSDVSEAVIDDEIRFAISKFDLTFDFIESGDDITVYLEYNSDIYYRTTAERILQHLSRLFDAVIQSPLLPLIELDYLSEREKELVLYEFNDTRSDYPRDKTITALFGEQVVLNPENIAVICGKNSLTYRELNENADRLAGYLRNSYQLGVGDLTAISLERSEWFVISILAILKTGGAYIPLDPDYPADRKEYIKNDTNYKVILNAEELEKFQESPTGAEPAITFADNEPDDLAYVMYTSGSTGKPKGVAVRHRSVIRLVKNQNYISLSDKDRILGLSNFSFDGSVFDTFGTLLNGGTFVIATMTNGIEAKEIAELIDAHSVSVFFLTTALFNVMMDHEFGNLAGLKYVLFGGEQVSVSRVEKFRSLYADVRLVHVYGPTENTTFSTYYPVGEVIAGSGTIPIGKSISNTTCFILNECLKLQPIGVVGQIYTGGDGLALEYLNRKELTAEKFIVNPFDKKTRLYATGDLGKWLPDGNVEFCGRKDDQVKIRGYRVEPGEIEFALKSIRSVISAIVVAVGAPDQEKSLVAYYLGKEEASSGDLRSKLKEILPAYMIPDYFIRLDVFPLTSNGKIDKKLLPVPDGRTISEATAYVAPRNEIEEKLVGIWSEILGIKSESIGIKDNFFELGGHSLKAIRLINSINKEFGLKYDLRGFYMESTIELIAEKLRVDLWFKSSQKEGSSENYSEIKL